MMVNIRKMERVLYIIIIMACNNGCNVVLNAFVYGTILPFVDHQPAQQRGSKFANLKRLLAVESETYASWKSKF